MSKKDLLEDRIKEKVKEGNISCSLLRKIAEEIGTLYKPEGEKTNQIKIKIAAPAAFKSPPE
jgi:hypothetical protein